MTSSKVYLAEVEDLTSASDGTALLGWLRPILESTASHDAWEGPVQDVESAFPDRGKVFWYGASSEVRIGDLLEITVDEQPTYDGYRRRERYQVSGEAHPALEVVDLRAWESEEEIRLALNSEGLPVDPPPREQEVLLWTPENRLVGPVGLREGDDTERWLLDKNDATRIDCWIPDEDALYRLDLKGGRYVAPPEGRFGERSGYVNWAPDVEFAVGVLKRIRKLDSAAYEALDVTYAVFEKYQELLQEAGLSDLELQHEQARLERIDEFQSTVVSNEQLLQEARDALLASEAVRAEIDARKQEIYAEAREQAEREIEDDLRELRDQLKGLEDTIERKKAARDAIDAEVAAKKNELDELIATFEERLSERLHEIESTPEDFFADSAILHTIFGRSRNGPSLQDPQPETTRLPGWDLALAAEPIEDLQEAYEAFVRGLFARGLRSKELGRDLFASLSTSGASFVAGTRAVDAVETFADTIAGGRVLWLPIPGTTLTPTDLLVAPRGDGRYTSHPGGLLDLLIEAEESDDLFLVVFEGVNRAPVESYLHPFVASRAECATSARRRRTIPLPSSFSPGADAPAPTSRVAWPANVLLACLPTSGSSALPIPSETWRRASLVDVDAYEVDRLSSGTSSSADAATEVTSATWTKWRRRLTDVDASPVSELVSSLRGEGDRLDDALPRELFSAATLLRGDTADALATCARLSIVPQSPTLSDSPQRWAETLHLESEEISHVRDLTESLSL